VVRFSTQDNAEGEEDVRLEQFVVEGKRVCLLLGLRDPESTARALRIEKHYGDEFWNLMRLGKYFNLVFGKFKKSLTLEYIVGQTLFKFRYDRYWEFDY
jgi:3'-phosphoadenosine 5'-phosphosulfate sulfotransferase (PAPS reductase)/FAD synthetase